MAYNAQGLEPANLSDAHGDEEPESFQLPHLLGKHEGLGPIFPPSLLKLLQGFFGLLICYLQG